MPEKILIVDDDPETSRLIGVMLQRQGYEIIAANNGEMAITMIKKDMPDLVVLDIMLPGIDGYAVSREIRDDPETAQIPILMFTAKSQIDDKVAGYGAGADDYLSKPVHPAELAVHVKSLLARSKHPTEEKRLTEPGFVIGVVGSKGGLGVSTLVLNLAISYNNLTKKEVMAVELKPGMGSWGIDLDIEVSNGLEKILALPLNKITPERIEKFGVHTSFGIRLIMASVNNRLVNFNNNTDKYLAMINALRSVVPVTVLDIGNPYFQGFDEICSLCNELLVITDALPATVLRTRRLLGNLLFETTVGSRSIDVILYHHMRADMMMSAEQISKLLPANPVRLMIPPVPEQIFEAQQKNIPLIKMQSNGFYAQQLNELSRILHTRTIG